MLRDESFAATSDDSTWTYEPRSSDSDTSGERHREIDRELRRIAAMHCGLDVEEARWLRLAEAEGGWRQLGYVNGLEYLEDVFGYRPRTAKDRLRELGELGELPELEEVLASGEMNYSVVRELTRVATPATVARWIEDARGKNLRDVEHMVSGHKKGDDPNDAPDPALVDHDVNLELDAERHALWRDLRKGLEDELGRSLDDKELIAEIHARVFAPQVGDGGADSNQVANAQAPRRMIHISTCRDCRRAWQDGAGVPMQIDGLTLDRIDCDAIICDEDRETRTESAIPEHIRRKVFERDNYKCTFPGCRATRNLSIRHIRHRADGGTHDSSNLTTQCDGHHGLHHDGVINISGQAPDALVFTRDGKPVGMSAPKPESSPVRTPSKGASTPPSKVDAETRSLAKTALTQAGYRAAIAKRAVELACAHVGTNADLTAVIKEALKHCG